MFAGCGRPVCCRSLAAVYPHLAVVLAGGNALVFALSLHCLRLLGEYEVDRTRSFDSNVDFASLYDQTPRRKALHLQPTPTSNPTPAAELQSDPATPAEPPIGARQEIALPERSGSENLGASASPPPCSLTQSRPKLPCALPPLPLSHPAPAVATAQHCGACQGPVHGLLPTTARSSSEPQTDRCTFVKYEYSFLYDYVSEMNDQHSGDDALKLCLAYGNACRGVVCGGSGFQECTMRAGSVLHDSKSEVAYVKKCFEPTTVVNAEVYLSKSGDNCLSASEINLNMSIALDLQTEVLQGAAIVVLAHDRAEDFRRCLQSLFGLKDIRVFQVFISLDELEKAAMMQAVAIEESLTHNVKIVDFWRFQPREIPSNVTAELKRWFSDYNTAKIAWHYWNAFEKAFTELKHDYAIFVEEDLVFSPDFASLFRSTAALLRTDSSIWCVSAWNDNSFPGISEDFCRLKRTSYFPGLGFLLTRVAWLTLRTWWTQSPTMGWDYWMRVAFRRAGKECIIPEVSRSRHVAAKGSSVNDAQMVQHFASMTTAEISTNCDAEQPCHQFGDVSYLLADRYEKALRAAISQAPRVVGGILPKLPSPGELFVMPYAYEETALVIQALGIQPSSGRNMPKDIRAEHLGVVTGRLIAAGSSVQVLAVDRRSLGSYLFPDENWMRDPNMVSVAAKSGMTCTQACADQQMICTHLQLPFLNDCNEMLKHFPCEDGCAHQVGPDMPAYVSGKSEPTYQQCLVTFISHLSCEGSHPSTSRLCACTR